MVVTPVLALFTFKFIRMLGVAYYDVEPRVFFPVGIKELFDEFPTGLTLRINGRQ